jgi:hypothetical protein
VITPISQVASRLHFVSVLTERTHLTVPKVICCAFCGGTASCVLHDDLFRYLWHFCVCERSSAHWSIRDTHDVQGSWLRSRVQQTLFQKRIYPTQVQCQPTSENKCEHFFFTWWRAPQQMLLTHHTLKAFCATLWWWAVFYQVLQVMEHQWNEIDRGKPTTQRKTWPSAILSTTNPTWTDPGSNPGLRNANTYFPKIGNPIIHGLPNAL